MVEAPGDSVPFSLEPILVEMEGGRYMSPILPASLSNLITGRRPAGGGTPKSGDSGGGGGGDGGGSSGGSSGTKKTSPKVAATGGVHTSEGAI